MTVDFTKNELKHIKAALESFTRNELLVGTDVDEKEIKLTRSINQKCIDFLDLTQKADLVSGYLNIFDENGKILEK